MCVCIDIVLGLFVIGVCGLGITSWAALSLFWTVGNDESVN